jgi:hypothetical protein
MTAQEILDSKIFDDVFREIEADLFNQFRRADPAGNELRGVAMRVWALGQVRTELERRLTKSAETRINGRV